MDRTGRFIYPQNPTLDLGMLRPDRGRHFTYWSRIFDEIVFVQYARYAIYHGLAALGVPSDSEVLVPAYHCAAAVEPIQAYGATARFYRVGPDLHADLNDIERRMSDKVRAVMCIHYCGFPQRVHELRALCDKWNVRLIEDCAHVLSGSADGVPLGKLGDISVFSLRKFFPTHDGGLLAINHPESSQTIQLHEPGMWQGLRIAKNLLEGSLLDSGNEWGKQAGRLLENLRSPRPRPFPEAESPESPPRATQEDQSDVAFDRQTAGLRMSRLSRWILGNQDIQRTIMIRRQNYETLVNELRDLSRVAFLFPELPTGVCPLHCPVTITGGAEYHLRLRARGIPATTWSKVVHPLLPRSEFPEADRLYRELIFLPVHQDLGEEEMKTTAAIVREVVTA